MVWWWWLDGVCICGLMVVKVKLVVESVVDVVGVDLLGWVVDELYGWPWYLCIVYVV